MSSGAEDVRPGNVKIDKDVLRRGPVIASFVAAVLFVLGGFVWCRTVTSGEPSVTSARHAAVETAAASGGGVQLWKDGPYWAECNVGASKPEESGYYFEWGDPVAYKRKSNARDWDWVSVKDGSDFWESHDTKISGMSFSWLRSEHYVDASSNLVAAVDAATAHLGAPWRMPTKSEFLALDEECMWEWIQRNGVSGLLVSGMGDFASKSIFLPAADGVFPGSGYYLSSTWFSYGTNDTEHGWCLTFGQGSFGWTTPSCYCGYAIRPIRGFVK